MTETVPEYTSVKRVSQLTGWSKAKIHRLLNDQKLAGKKDGRSTLVLLESVRIRLASLPDR